ncbi:MAG: ABC transporter ATP-binding protein, partial [Rhizobiaceae bacterium]|nr:ABC transporter ATP-binding protein [Rhizobiaceae bacterium]
MLQNARAAEIRANGIGKTFGTFKALKDVSIDIGRGEFLTLLGPSGSGKTTFLMILAGFEQPTEGTLFSNGVDVTRQPAEQRSSGMVFQGYALFPHMTVEGNIAFPLHVRKMDAETIRKRVGEMVDRVGLRGHEKKKPSQLSGGQQQRVALARALVFEPGVLLLDEPFSALDKSLREQMQQEVKRLHEDTGTTFVFVTHDQSEALALSSRVAIFNHGALQQIGTPQDVYERPANRFVAEFLGEINLLPISSVERVDRGVTALCEDRRVTVRQPGAPVGGRALLAVRPEHMTLSAAPGADENG